jgi:hypothetical protein
MAKNHYSKRYLMNQFLKKRGWCLAITLAIMNFWIMGWAIDHQDAGYSLASGITGGLFVLIALFGFIESDDRL